MVYCQWVVVTVPELLVWCKTRFPTIIVGLFLSFFRKERHLRRADQPVLPPGKIQRWCEGSDLLRPSQDPQRRCSGGAWHVSWVRRQLLEQPGNHLQPARCELCRRDPWLGKRRKRSIVGVTKVKCLKVPFIGIVRSFFSWRPFFALISDQHDSRLTEQWWLQLWWIQQITQTQAIIPKTHRKR